MEGGGGEKDRKQNILVIIMILTYKTNNIFTI